MSNSWKWFIGGGIVATTLSLWTGAAIAAQSPGDFCIDRVTSTNVCPHPAPVAVEAQSDWVPEDLVVAQAGDHHLPQYQPEDGTGNPPPPQDGQAGDPLPPGAVHPRGELERRQQELINGGNQQTGGHHHGSGDNQVQQ